MLALSKDHLQIFGAYTDVPWTSTQGFKEGNGNSFIFSLREDLNFVKLKCINKEKEVYHDIKFMFSFGECGNLTVLNDCNIKNSNHSRLGCENSYETPKGIHSDSS